MQSSGTISEPRTWRWPALLNLGFRPFFLLGVLWGILTIAIWVSIQAGALSQVVFADPVAWHAHEMIFGYALAIIAGFVLTASQNWTGIRGVREGKLLLLVGAWLAGRVASLFWCSSPVLFTLIDLSFLPLLAWALVPYLWQKAQQHNKVFFLMFSVLFCFNLGIHLNALGVTTLPSRSFLLGGVHLIIIMIALVGGRVIPFFAGVVIKDLALKRNERIELLSFVLLILFLVCSVLWEFSLFTAVAAAGAAGIQFYRWLSWKPWRSLKIPVLFILYIAYLWIPVGLAFRALAAMGALSSSVATHALTAGCIGTMIYGMITRVALGHTGRAIQVSSAIVVGYALITFSALFRVIGPLIAPGSALMLIAVSGAFWGISHFIFLTEYTPYLLLPRADGKEG